MSDDIAHYRDFDEAMSRLMGVHEKFEGRKEVVITPETFALMVNAFMDLRLKIRRLEPK